jgi:hypothetical protein
MGNLDQNFNGAMHNPAIADALRSADISALIKIFDNWREELPDIEETVAAFTAPYNFSDKSQSLILAAAKLAAEPATNAYHSNTHFLKVATVATMLGANALQENRITKPLFALLITSALIHDYRHDGTTNKGEMFRLEKIAFENAKPSLMEAGADQEDLELIKAFIYTTDVSASATSPDATSPAEQVKVYALTGDVRALGREFKILHVTETSDVALMLEDADLIAGGITKPEHLEYESMLLAKERNMEFTRASADFFIEEVCHRQLFSKSGAALFQPYMDYLIAYREAQEEFIAGQNPTP